MLNGLRSVLLIVLFIGNLQGPATATQTTDLVEPSLYFDEIWKRRVTANLEQSNWTSSYLYSAGLYFYLPLIFSFDYPEDTYRKAFHSHFMEFDTDGFRPSNGWLSNAQYAHLVSTYINLEQKSTGSTELTDSLYEKLTSFVLSEWSVNSVAEWPDFDFIGRANSIAAKIDKRQRPVTDSDMFLFAIAADLVVYASEEEISVDSKLIDILSLSATVFEKIGTFDSTLDYWLFDAYGWSNHPDYLLANWDGKGDVPIKQINQVLGWDTSHAYRFPHWLRSLKNSTEITGIGSNLYDKVEVGLINSFVETVLYQPDSSSKHWATTNYMSGVNGVFRFGYKSFLAGEGYLPGGLSGTLLLGSWSLLNSPVIFDMYEDLTELDSLSPAMLELYKEPPRKTVSSGQFNWNDILNSGDIKLWTSIASSTQNKLIKGIVSPSSDAPRVLVAPSSTTPLDSMLPILANADTIEIYLSDRHETDAKVANVNTELPTKTVLSMSVDELSSYIYSPGHTAHSNRLYWRTVAPDLSVWRAVDVIRDNETVEISLDSNIFSLSDGMVGLASYVKLDDADNDQISYAQVYDSSLDSPGLMLDGDRLPTKSTQTISAEQWFRLKVDSTLGKHYIVRVTDGSSWSDWLTVKFDATKPLRFELSD